MQIVSETTETLNAPTLKLQAPEEEKNKGYEKLFEEILFEKFPNMGKEVGIQLQEAQRVLHSVSPKKHVKTHIKQSSEN